MTTTQREESGTAAPARTYAGIAVCSIGVLMMEILLTRIFSFTVWYHLAYLTISTALLGFGAAGSVLSAFPGLSRGDVSRLAALCTAGAGLTLIAAIAILASRPIEPSLILQEPVSFSIGLLGYYLAIAVPFFLAGIAVAAPLAAYPAQVNRLYARGPARRGDRLHRCRGCSRRGRWRCGGDRVCGDSRGGGRVLRVRAAPFSGARSSGPRAATGRALGAPRIGVHTGSEQGGRTGADTAWHADALHALESGEPRRSLRKGRPPSIFLDEVGARKGLRGAQTARPHDPVRRAQRNERLSGGG